MEKSFEKWLKDISVRKFRGSKACYLLNLSGDILKEFDNLLQCSRYLNMTQLSENQYNNGCIIKSKYRVFTISYYVKNKVNIKKLKSYTQECKKMQEMHRKQNIIICDLFPNEEFLYIKPLSDKLGKSSESVRLILRGKTISNPYNIRYKYRELRNKDFRSRYQKIISNSEILNNNENK